MTAAEVWSLPAGALACDLVRHGGSCSVQGDRRRYKVELSDGRLFVDCGLEGDPEPASVVGRCVTVVLCAIPGSEYALVSPSVVVACKERAP